MELRLSTGPSITRGDNDLQATTVPSDVFCDQILPGQVEKEESMSSRAAESQGNILSTANQACVPSLCVPASSLCSENDDNEPAAGVYQRYHEPAERLPRARVLFFDGQTLRPRKTPAGQTARTGLSSCDSALPVRGGLFRDCDEFEASDSSGRKPVFPLFKRLVMRIVKQAAVSIGKALTRATVSLPNPELERRDPPPRRPSYTPELVIARRGVVPSITAMMSDGVVPLSTTSPAARPHAGREPEGRGRKRASSIYTEGQYFSKIPSADVSEGTGLSPTGQAPPKLHCMQASGKDSSGNGVGNRIVFHIFADSSTSDILSPVTPTQDSEAHYGLHRTGSLETDKESLVMTSCWYDGHRHDAKSVIGDESSLNLNEAVARMMHGDVSRL